MTDNRSTAQQYLATVKAFRPDAYITSMGAWCRNQRQRDGFVECLSRP
ncbi:MAG: hypothetical protein WC291_06620 [Thermodesulfovibrionales bacterium]